jgi:hypothetical protein
MSSVLINVYCLDDLIQAVIVTPLEKSLEEVLVRVIHEHVLLRRDPTLREIETNFLQVELEHLERLHQKGADPIPPLGIRFST